MQDDDPPNELEHFSSHGATGNTEEFQHFRVSTFPLRLPSVPLCLCERPTPHACAVGMTMPIYPPVNPVIDSLRSPFGLPLAVFLCYASIPVLLFKKLFSGYPPIAQIS